MVVVVMITRGLMEMVVETEGGKVVEDQSEDGAADRWQFCHRDS